MKRIYLLSLGVLLSASLGAKADDASLRDELAQIKDDITVIQRQLYRERSDLSNNQPTSGASTAQVRLGEYGEMIREMNGKVENIEYRLNTLEKKLDGFNKDIELRFEQFKRQISTATPAPQAKKNSAPAAKNTAINKAPTGTKPQELYEKALRNLKDNQLTKAETEFSQFLNSFPKDVLAGNAQYWLGEVYYKQQNFAKAAVAFKEGYSKYPEGTKGPDCLLKLGLSMKALNKKEDACTAFVNLPTIFGKVNPDIAARAVKEAEALGCK